MISSNGDNDELQRIWKEPILANFNTLSSLWRDFGKHEKCAFRTHTSVFHNCRSKFKAFRIIYYKLLDFKNSTHTYTIKTSQYALHKHC
jgi:hypothetical protein